MWFFSFVVVPITTLLLYLFIAAAAVQGVYYLLIFSRFAFFGPRKEDAGPAGVLPPVSVVVCAKNEGPNLLENLPHILNQDYPTFEVVVVNDASWDNTADVLMAFQQSHPNLNIATVKETSSAFPGKKFALTIGIKAATHELLVLTDADCKPKSDQWLREQAAMFTPGTDVVLGYGAFQKTRGMLNRLIRFDGFFVALQYLSFSLWGAPYMGVGRNLAYRKSLFFENKGFASHRTIASGDDDLFINEVATGKNTRIVNTANSHTVTPGKTTFADWVLQKRRHLTTGVRYKLRDKILLGLLSASQLGFYFLFALLLVLQIEPQLVLIVFGARLLVQLLTFGFAMKKLGEADLLYLFPLYEVLITVLHPLLFIINLIMPRPAWKS